MGIFDQRTSKGGELVREMKELGDLINNVNYNIVHELFNPDLRSNQIKLACSMYVAHLLHFTTFQKIKYIL